MEHLPKRNGIGGGSFNILGGGLGPQVQHVEVPRLGVELEL